MSICDSVCNAVKDCLQQVVVCLYKQPIVKKTVTDLFIMYDKYYESQQTEEEDEEEFDLDDLLADCDDELKMD